MCCSFSFVVYVDLEYISNFSDVYVVVEGVMVGALHGNQELSNSLSRQHSVLSFGQCLHCALHEEELLLEVVKADSGVDLIPVANLGFIGQVWVGVVHHSLEATVHTLVVENIEQLLEQKSIAEVSGNVFDNPTSSDGENLVEQNPKVMSLFFDASSLLQTDGGWSVSDLFSFTGAKFVFLFVFVLTALLVLLFRRLVLLDFLRTSVFSALSRHRLRLLHFVS